MTKKVKNIAASVRARLLKIAKENGRDFNAVLLQYFQERMLYRLSISYYRSNFVLKGALLFLIYDIPRLRPTKDIDFLGVDFPNKKEILVDAIKVILSMEEEDGVIFNAEEITAEDITKDADYNGVRIFCEAYLGRAKRRLHFDIGFGDKIVPKPLDLDFPVLLSGMPVPSLVAYTPESAIAEKFEATVNLGYANSRLKDFYDIYHLAHNYSFSSEIILEAITTTFTNRNTELEERSLVFSNEFMQNADKNKQWKAFLHKNNIELDIEFENCVGFIQTFIEPLFTVAKLDYKWDYVKLNWIK
jgi:predicted nucleotidyltransferase component of viral defense system